MGERKLPCGINNLRHTHSLHKYLWRIVHMPRNAHLNIVPLAPVPIH